MTSIGVMNKAYGRKETGYHGNGYHKSHQKFCGILKILFGIFSVRNITLVFQIPPEVPCFRYNLAFLGSKYLPHKGVWKRRESIIT